MAQGLLKKSKSSSSASSSSSKRTPSLGPKRGQGSIKPKKSALLKQHKMNKKLSGGLTTATEMNLAKRAGHLEILAGGKKGKNKDKGKAAGDKKS
ncbi:hypothetical protein PHISP_05540 [Aspergillus sp. HF37]|nr:hypothetical protein PHISP_05540 [Aspergillus sp. HF37]